MSTFIMLTKLGTGISRTAPNLEQLERSAVDRVQEQCPNVRWLHSYAVLGRPDYVDIFTAPPAPGDRSLFAVYDHVIGPCKLPGAAGRSSVRPTTSRFPGVLPAR